MKVRNLDLILEQCINEADFEEADKYLEKIEKLCKQATEHLEQDQIEQDEIDYEL